MFWLFLYGSEHLFNRQFLWSIDWFGMPRPVKRKAVDKAAEAVEPEDIDWESMTVVKLKAELQAKNLDVTGKKADLVKRLREQETNGTGMSANQSINQSVEQSQWINQSLNHSTRLTVAHHSGRSSNTFAYSGLDLRCLFCSSSNSRPDWQKKVQKGGGT